MSVARQKPTDELAILYTRFLEQHSEEWRTRFIAVCRERARQIALLNKQGVRTVADLLSRLPCLSPKLKMFGIELTWLLKIRQAVPVLLEVLLEPKADRALRITCAFALYMLKAGKTTTRVFVGIGKRELRSDAPDCNWLEAVIHGLGAPDDQQAIELLVSIFERVDLPGSLRGDAADKLGCVGRVSDRRTGLFRRCRDAAMRGLTDDSIHVRFWSMYLIGSLCSDYRSRRGPRITGFESVLPRLREIAATDQRLAPGYWWPMSGEAEDVIVCIENGGWRDPEAAERYPLNSKRGVDGPD